MHSMSVVIGGQWGDEGKGKIVDCLVPEVDVVIRYQGGANAGHTVKVGEKKFVLHLLPTGILHEKVRCLLGGGMVVDTWALLEELDELKANGVDADSRVYLASSAHLVLPFHRRIDELREKSLQRKNIGTTGRGIGPTYEDKMSRMGLRVGDLLLPDENLRRLVIEKVLRANQYLAARFDAPAMAAEAIGSEIVEHAQRLRPMIVDSFDFLAPVRAGAWRALLEGAQGTLLDIDHGSYPFVTSSNCTVGGALTGTGLPPQLINRVTLVLKAYCTRVGNGPFPTELHGEEAEALRQAGHEFGATTGRPRRPGWFDAVAARYAAEINGATEIALTKLDVLTGLEQVKVCTAYTLDDKTIDSFPADAAQLERCKPVYTELPGWSVDFSAIKDYRELPENARAYVATLEKLIGCRVRYVSTGPQREQFIDRDQTASVQNRSLGTA